MVAERIRHTVAFALVHPEGSAGEHDFLEAAARLASVPGVETFELLAEISPKNGFRFGISMEFADRGAYERYNEHPDHVRFVQERWLSEVTDFLELDYAALDGSS
jgi:stress responsive alpha/beta barrel protein